MKQCMRYLLFSVSISLLCPLALADTATTLGVQASGQCLKKVAQDRGSIVVTTSVVADSPKEASAQATKAHERVKTEVGKLTLRDFQSETINYSIHQECRYENNKQVCKGFRANYETRFETSEIERIGEAISTAAERSTEQVSQLHTFVSPTKLKGERESCLEIAGRDAKSKALKLASGAGVQLGRLVALAEIPESLSISPHQPRIAYAVEAMTDTAGSPTIESKPIDVEVSVRATYAIE